MRLKTAPTNERQECSQIITTTTESDDRSVQDSLDVTPIGDGVLTGTPEAPETGTQMYTTKQDVKMRTSVSDGMIYVAFGDTGTPEETIVTFSPEQAYYLAKRLTVLAASTARQSPTVALTNDREEETR